MSKNTQGLASHTDSPQSDIITAKHRIKEVLERRAGEDDAEVTSPMLARQVPVSQSTVRDIIQQLIDDGLPIVSGPTGYRLIDSKAELHREIGRIEAEIQTREESKRRLAKAFNQRHYNDG